MVRQLARELVAACLRPEKGHRSLKRIARELEEELNATRPGPAPEVDDLAETHFSLIEME